MTSHITISNHSELVAAVPHLLGFVPTDSVVCIPIGTTGPIARADHPHNDPDIIGVVRAMADCYLREPGSALAVLAITEDRVAAVKSAAALTHVLRDQVAVALWVDGDRWTNLATGKTGSVSQQASTRMAAEAVVRGNALPAASRDHLVRALRGDSTAVAELLPAAKQHAERISGPSETAEEKAWITETIDRFRNNQLPLNEAAAARMLVAIQTLELRDCAWGTITRADARTHVALWHDLTRRSPESVRTPAAALLGFSSWLAGHGAQAWIALELISEHENCNLARLVGVALESALPPSAWDADAEPPAAERSLLQQAHLNTPAVPERPVRPPMANRGRSVPPGIDI